MRTGWVIVGVIGGLLASQQGLGMGTGQPIGRAAVATPGPKLADPALDVPTGTHPRTAGIASTKKLGYDGGSVLHSNRTHVIFWQPSGSGLTFDPGYQALVETFLKDVARDSHRPSNVYGLSGQYHDSTGPAAYASAHGRDVLDTDKLPSSDCVEPPVAGPGWIDCLSDAALEAEIQHVVSVNHLPTTNQDVYFLVTPKGLGSCFANGPSECALGGPSTGGYCGYHSNDGSILYAVIPYNAVSGHCQSGNPRPNSNAADPAISTISHEHNEMVTDPFGTGYIDSSGEEDGDLCLTEFGPKVGGSGPTAYNESIHHGHFWLQEEWSNEDRKCMPRDEADHISFGAPARVRVGSSARFAGWAHDPDGSITAYHWSFGDGALGHHRDTTHTFRKSGAYSVMLRTTDSADNYAFFTRVVRVVRR